MSITLDIKPYCQRCTRFDVEVSKHEIYETGICFGYPKRETAYRIRCANRDLCEALKSYLQENEQKGE